MPCIQYWFPCKSPRGVHGTHYSVCTPRGDFAISAYSSRTIAISVEILIFQHHHKGDFLSRPSLSSNLCIKTQPTCKTTKDPTCLERVPGRARIKRAVCRLTGLVGFFAQINSVKRTSTLFQHLQRGHQIHVLIQPPPITSTSTR